MQASERSRYLNALGVVQYRRRSLSVVVEQSFDVEQPKDSAQPAVEGYDQTKVTETAASATTATGSRPNTKISEIFSNASSKQEANELVRELEAVHDDLSGGAHSYNQDSHNQDNQSLANTQTEFGFDLLVWRTEKLLVLEFSQAQTEDVSLKHLLANNILKALWPQEFKGVEMHQHSWPMRGVAADISSATEWLNALLAGHLHQQAQYGGNMPIWLMGEAGLKMLFSDSGQQQENPEQSAEPRALSELIGTSTRHEKLGVELIISPGLKQISESAVAKAQAWQLLKAVR